MAAQGKVPLLFGVNLVAFALLFYVRKRFDLPIMTFAMTPIAIYLLMVILGMASKVHGALMLFGKHSMNMWLIHSFFCFYYFQNLFFSISRNPIISYVVLVLLSLLSAIAVTKFWTIIQFIKRKLT